MPSSSLTSARRCGSSSAAPPSLWRRLPVIRRWIEQHATGLEPDNQVLAATLDRRDALALQLGRHLGRLVRAHEPRVVDLDALEAPSRRARARAGGAPSRPRAARASVQPRRGLELRPALAERVEDDRPRPRRLVAELVRGEHVGGGLVGRAPRRARGSRRAARPPRRRRRASSGRRRRRRGRSASSFVAPAGAEVERREADRERREPLHVARRAARRPRGRTAPSAARPRRGRRPARAPSARTPRRRSRRRPPASARRRASARSMPRSESASRCARRVEHELREVGAARRRAASPTASRTSSAFPTARPSGWSMSVSTQTTSRPARWPSAIIVSASTCASGERLHERAVADLDVEHDRVGAGGDLLRHDARRDQRHVVDRRRDVAQRVELLVGRHEIRRLADDREADVAHLRDELVRRQLDAEAGNRLELVERAARVAEPAAAHLPERHAARGDDRADGERRLVADAAGRVLVDDAAAERRAEVDRLAAPHHRVGQRERLGAREALEVDGHAERRQLVVGHVAARVREDELARAPPRRAPPRRACAGSARRRGSPRPAPRRRRHAASSRGTAPSISGTSGARCARSIVAATNVAHRLGVGKDERRLDVAPLDAARSAGASSSAPFAWLKLSGSRGSTPVDELPELRHVVLAVASTRRAVRPAAARARTRRSPARDPGRGRAPSRRTTQSNSPSSNGKLLRVGDLRVDARARARARPCAPTCRSRRRPRRAPSRTARVSSPEAAADVEHARRLRLGDGVERDVLGIVALRSSARKIALRFAKRSSLAYSQRTSSGLSSFMASRIGWPGIPREGAFPLEPGVHGRADVGELALVDLARTRCARRRTRAASRARASGRSTASSGRSRGRT